MIRLNFLETFTMKIEANEQAKAQHIYYLLCFTKDNVV